MRFSESVCLYSNGDGEWSCVTQQQNGAAPGPTSAQGTIRPNTVKKKSVRFFDNGEGDDSGHGGSDEGSEERVGVGKQLEENVFCLGEVEEVSLKIGCQELRRRRKSGSSDCFVRSELKWVFLKSTRQLKVSRKPWVVLTKRWSKVTRDIQTVFILHCPTKI